MFSPDRLTFSLEIERFHEEINIGVATSTGELRMYFEQILKRGPANWAGAQLAVPILQVRSKLKRAQLKFFSLGGTFRLSWASQPIASVSVNDSWKGRIRQL